MVDLAAFLQTHFIQPILDPSVPGYNPVNTIVYGLILLGAAFYVIYPRLNKRGVQFDWKFMKALLPYILFGTSLRVLEDQKVLMRSVNPLDLGFYIYTPGVWVLTFVLVMIGLLLGHVLAKKNEKSSHTYTFWFGLVLALPLFVYNLLNAEEIMGALAIVALTAGVGGIVFWVARQRKWAFLDSTLAKTAFIGQLLDTSATFVALEFFSCGEQHVLPRLLFGAFGNISFFFVKIPLVLLVLYWLHKEFHSDAKADPNLYRFILIFLSILGLATGTRDLLTVLVGTCSL